MVVKIIKRDGRIQDCDFGQIMTRLVDFNTGRNVNYVEVCNRIKSMFPNDGFISTHEIDKLAVRALNDLYIETKNINCEMMARSILISDLNHTVPLLFSGFVQHAYELGLFHPNIYKFVMTYASRIDQFCIDNSDKEMNISSLSLMYYYDIYLWKHIERDGEKFKTTVIERPTYMFMRSALAAALPSYLFDNLENIDDAADSNEDVIIKALSSKTKIRNEDDVFIDVRAEDIEEVFARIKEFYVELIDQRISPATPIVHSACMRNQRFTSCFIGVQGDSIEKIFGKGGIESYARLSKGGGGIGISMSRIRSNGSAIKGTNGTTKGIIPWMKNNGIVADTVDQGGNKRAGSFAIYLEPWHGDIEAFIKVQGEGDGSERIHSNIFLAVWIPDLLIRRVKSNGKWSLFCPRDTPDLPLLFDNRLTGDMAFTRRYEYYESIGIARKEIGATSLLTEIVRTAMERNGPYILSKDAANSYSNQVFTNFLVSSENGEYYISNEIITSIIMNQSKEAKYESKEARPEPAKAELAEPAKPWNIINNSNLCTEIFEVNSPNSIASCNLMSMILKNFVDLLNKKLNSELLIKSAGIACHMLNRYIDNNKYIGEITMKNNMEWRPIAIGVQGMASLLIRCDYDDYICPEAQDTYALAAECIYYGALTASNELAVKSGKKHSKFDETLYARGLFHFDIFGQNFKSTKHNNEFRTTLPSMSTVIERRHEILQLPLERWEKLGSDIMRGGLINSLFCAWMPTASSAIGYGSTENFEPITTIIYNKKNKGEWIMYNADAIEELMKLEKWPEIYKHLCVNHYLRTLDDDVVPKRLKNKYKAACEYNQIDLIKMASRAHLFIDQGMSLNLHYQTDRKDLYTVKNVMSAVIAAWSLGHKTLLYYIRRNDLTARHKIYKREHEEVEQNSNKLIKLEDQSDKMDEDKEDSDHSEENSDQREETSDQNEEDSDQREEEIMVCSRENGPNCSMCSA